MIVVDLICEHEHRFEGWFACSEDIESQQQRGLLTCAICGSHNMRRLPSAPHVQGSSDKAEVTQHEAATETTTTSVAAQQPEAQQLLQVLVKKLQESAAQSEDVGEDFPQEARRIHFGDAEERAIRGKATNSEVASLLDEGISVLPMPIAKEDLH
ncbi:DUF1178 family protein [Uliginosibacterium sp. H3]|uniref:DUF1178 family protein n=1 Tax=Uliginosibacterium silvisoli TaxID=3114758 RepID=A0ABU6K5H1_9RHOO|nr:DUF1178 family protein [Uliginosibacterium sp. H3]